MAAAQVVLETFTAFTFLGARFVGAVAVSEIFVDVAVGHGLFPLLVIVKSGTRSVPKRIIAYTLR